MFSQPTVRPDFADTEAAIAPRPRGPAVPPMLDQADAEAAIAQADRADSQLLGLVAGVAGVTLALAFVSSLAAF